MRHAISTTATASPAMSAHPVAQRRFSPTVFATTSATMPRVILTMNFVSVSLHVRNPVSLGPATAIVTHLATSRNAAGTVEIAAPAHA